MRHILFLLGLIIIPVLVFAQHDHHKTRTPAKDSTIKQKKSATGSKDPVKKTTTAKDSTRKIHRHQLDDSTVLVHDENHNEIPEQPKTVSPKKDSTKPTHRHSMDSTVLRHDERKDIADSMSRPSPVDTIPPHRHHHDVVDTNSVMVDTLVSHDHGGHGDHDMGNMSHAFSLNLPMNRNGSGTAWLPDASPMYGYMFHSPRWMFMLHGNAFLRYNNQDFTNKGSRGGSKVDIPNWVMFMGQRRVGNNGLFHFNTMFSLDAAIAGGSGYPLLFQSGELYQGKPLVDRQHPHDLFSELSISYAHALSNKVDVFGYLAYPGEPALGPVAFMHRPSSLNNPDAPITHHWVDATHITFGVATLGVRIGQFKLEGSSFTGREPDEKRFGFDKPRFDSWSTRLSFNPSDNWALQVSHGFLESPETLHPGEDINRTSASVIYSKRLTGGTFNATALWGMNKAKEHDGEHAALLEAAWNKNKLTIHGRFEYVQKSVEELVLDETVFGHHAIFDVNSLTAGFNYDIFNLGKTRFALGSQLTFYSADKRLDQLYGKNPMAAEVYLRIYPTLMN